VPKTERITIKIGGHIFPVNPDPKIISEFSAIFKKIASGGTQLIVVTGGGENARNYIKAARTLGADEATCDQIGIEICRIHAQLFISNLDETACPDVPKTIHDVKNLLHYGKTIVMGGLTPGHSTTAVGALVAEATKSKFFIIASNVDGIYTADPKVDPKAEKLDEIRTKELITMALSGKYAAGTYELDPVAVKAIERSKIPTVFIDGRRPENILKAIQGQKVGTRIIP
jgi:uridylate kinase